MNGYATQSGKDQNGQTIKQYTNNQQQCKNWVKLHIEYSISY